MNALGLIPKLFVGLSKPDSYVIAKLGSLSFKTSSVAKNDNPQWDEKW
jgi:hypothetical protein